MNESHLCVVCVQFDSTTIRRRTKKQKQQHRKKKERKYNENFYSLFVLFSVQCVLIEYNLSELQRSRIVQIVLRAYDVLFFVFTRCESFEIPQNIWSFPCIYHQLIGIRLWSYN